MLVTPQEEEAGRAEALKIVVQAAAVTDLPDNHQPRLRQVVSRRWNAFRRALREDPSASMELLLMTLKPGAQAAKARGRKYSPARASWLTACVTTLVALALVFVNPQGVWASPAMAVSKKGDYKLRERLPGGQHSIQKGTDGNAQRGGGYGSVERGSRVWKARHVSGLLAMSLLRGSLNRCSQSRLLLTCTLPCVYHRGTSTPQVVFKWFSHNYCKV